MNYSSFIGASWEAFTTKWREWFPKVKKTFIGTRAEWNQLTTAEKKNYDAADLTDDTVGGEMVVADTVASGNMNPVTSNAVYNKLTQYQPRSYATVMKVNDTTLTIDLNSISVNSNVSLYTTVLEIVGGNSLHTQVAISLGRYANIWRVVVGETIVDAGSTGAITASISNTTLTVNCTLNYGGRLYYILG